MTLLCFFLNNASKVDAWQTQVFMHEQVVKKYFVWTKSNVQLITKYFPNIRRGKLWVGSINTIFEKNRSYEILSISLQESNYLGPRFCRIWD